MSVLSVSYLRALAGVTSVYFLIWGVKVFYITKFLFCSKLCAESCNQNKHFASWKLSMRQKSSGIPAEPSPLIKQWELSAPGSWHFVNSTLYAQRLQLLPRTEPCVRRTWGICIKFHMLKSACLHFAFTVMYM